MAARKKTVTTSNDYIEVKLPKATSLNRFVLV